MHETPAGQPTNEPNTDEALTLDKDTLKDLQPGSEGPTPHGAAIQTILCTIGCISEWCYPTKIKI